LDLSLLQHSSRQRERQHIASATTDAVLRSCGFAEVINLYEGLDALPKSLRIYGASDYATMEPRKGRKEPDYSEHGVWGIDKIGDLWAIDWWSKQCETDISIAAFIRLIAIWKPALWGNEGGLIDKAIGPAIRSAMRHSQKYVAVESLPSLEDKGVKLQAFHARATAGTIHLPVNRKWSDGEGVKGEGGIITQLVKFPTGRWDDKCDVCGLIGRMVDKMFDARLPPTETRDILVPFTEKWLMYNDVNAKPKERFF
jgi:phage terminase large subunit-like protein